MRHKRLWGLAVVGGLLALPLATSPSSGPRTAHELRVEREATPGAGHDDEIDARDRWFYRQRAYPNEHTPPGALRNARAQAARLPTRPPRRPSSASTAVAGLSWSSIGPHPITYPGGDYYQGRSPLAGRVSAVAPVPGSSTTAYIGGAAGGVWKTTDSGAHWTPLSDTQPALAVGAIAVDPSNTSVVYVGTGEGNLSGDNYFGNGIFKSTNGGATWSKIGGSTLDDCYVTDLALQPGTPSTLIATVMQYGRYYTGCAYGVYRSTDGGATWSRVLNGSPTDISFDPSTPNNVYVAVYTQGIYRSTDGGATWNLLGGGLPTSPGRGAVAVAPSNSQVVYAAFQEGAGTVYESTDGGSTWNPVAGTPPFCNAQCWYDLVLAVSPSDPGTLYAGGITLWRHTSGGWSQFGTNVPNDSTGIHVDQHALAFDSSGRLWVGNDGGVYRLTSDEIVSDLNADLSIAEFEPGVAGGLGTKIVGGLQDDGTITYSGDTAWHMIIGGDGGAAAIDPANPNVIYSSYIYGSVSKTTDGGESWIGITPAGFDSNRTQFYPPFTMHPANASRLYLGDYRLWRSTNGGSGWSLMSGDATGGFGDLTAIGPAPGNTSTVYVGSNGGHVQVTTNDGASWNDATTGLPGRFVTDFDVSPTDAQIAYVTISGFGIGHVFKTTNGGASWADVSGDLPDSPANAVAVDYDLSPATIYVGTDVGVFSSTDGGTSWEKESTGFPNAVVMDLKIDSASNELIAATHGRGAWAATLPPALPTITSFAPTSGTLGTAVTIKGVHLGGATAVEFNGTPAPINSNSATQITTAVPDGATTGPITVTTGVGTGTSATSFTVLAALPPTVSSFSPGSGAVGTLVTVNGTNFSSATAVTFGGVAATPTIVSPTQVRATVPAAAKTGKIGVTNPGGTALSVGTFKVLPKLTSFGPGSGAAGASVTIAGTGFTDVSTVKFNGVAANFGVDSDHQITATVPAAATTGKLSVVTAGGTAASLTNFVVVPTITGFSPGSAAAGSPVFVDGTGFGGVSSVKVNGVAAGFARLSAVQLRLTVPAAASSGTITVTTGGGTASSAATLAVLPRVTGFTPSAAAVGATVTISGNAFGGASGVLFNGVLAVPATVTATKVTVVVPADASTGKLSVVTGAGSGQSVGTFKVLPKLTSFTPPNGPAGAVVTISGSGFTDVSAVKLNGVAAGYTVDSDHQITATVPATATTGRLSVVTAGGTATSTTSFLAVPTISGFSPGGAAAGSFVFVDGTGFGGSVSVKVNGTPAAFTRFSALQLRLTVPAAASSGTITVTTGGGTATSAGALAVLPRVTGFTPSAALAGATLTIGGNAFGGATDVLFNGVAAVPATVLATKITVPVPADASTGKLTVVTAAGPGQSVGTFRVLPKLTSFSPGAGVVGTGVTIAGTGFTDVTTVKFNGHAASTWTRDSSTQITAFVPLGATTGKVTVVTAGGTTTSATAFTVVP